MNEPIFDFSGLTVEQRLRLIEQLWESLKDESLPMSAELAAELDRRVASLDEEGDPGEPAEIVLDRVRKQLG